MWSQKMLCVILMMIASFSVNATRFQMEKPHVIENADKNDKGKVAFHEANVSNDANSMRVGIIEEVDAKKRKIKIKDQLFEVDPARIRVFYNGSLVSFSQVVVGAKIRFLLDPSIKKSKISVIYLN